LLEALSATERGELLEYLFPVAPLHYISDWCDENWGIDRDIYNAETPDFEPGSGSLELEFDTALPPLSGLMTRRHHSTVLELRRITTHLIVSSAASMFLVKNTSTWIMKTRSTAFPRSLTRYFVLEKL
jgi:hypothetical protein